MPTPNQLTGVQNPERRRHGLVGLLRTAWQEYERDHAGYLAVAMVYYALVSLVPLLLLVLAVLGLLLRYSDLAAAAEEQVLRTIETSFGAPLRITVERLFEQLQNESVVASFIGLGGLLLTASGLFRHLRSSFRAIWKHAPTLVSGPARVAIRATFLEYVTAYVMVLAGGLLLVATLALIAVTQRLSGLFVTLPLVERMPAWLLALPGSFILTAITFALLFKFLPPVRLRWRDVWLAVVLCTAGWIIGAEILALSGMILGDSPTASGAFGGLLVMMLWFKVVSQLLFYGAELCKVVAWQDNPEAH